MTKRQTALSRQRKGAGLSMLELARLAQTTRQHIHLLESGEGKPSLRVARRVAKALGQTVDVVFPPEVQS